MEQSRKYEDLTIQELINLLVIVIGEKEKVYRYHPDNPKGVNVVDEYNSLLADIERINNLITVKSK